jgi:hypothetical protein
MPITAYTGPDDKSIYFSYHNLTGRAKFHCKKIKGIGRTKERAMIEIICMYIYRHALLSPLIYA